MIERDGRRLRHEFKYHLDPLEYRHLAQKLAVVLGRDGHAGPDGRYNIRSLYFDDFRNTALFEKQAGLINRMKYRLRIYDHSDRVIKLECKSKFDRYISKESVGLSRSQADRILAGDVDFCRESRERLLRAFYLEWRRNHMRPIVIVEYDREAYVHPVGNVRITFDIGVRSAMGSTALFDPDVFTLGVIEEPGVVMEVKYDNVLPSHIQGLFLNTIQPRSAIGKYVISRKHIKMNSWEDM